MTRSTVRTALQPIGIALAAGAGGILLQSLAFGGLVQMAPGRLATLPVAILLGPWLGTLAAAVGTASFITTRPLLSAIFVLEACVIGAVSATGRSPLLGGAGFWAAMVLAFAAFPDQFAAGHLQGSIWPLALQQMLNGLMGVVLADLIAAVVAVRSPGHDRPRRLRGYAFHSFVLVAIIPVLILSVVTGQLFAARQEAEGGTRLTEIASATGDRIHDHVLTQRRVVETLAASLSSVASDEGRRSTLIRMYSQVHPSLDHITIVDAQGTVLDSTSRGFATSELRRRGVADRAYFKQAMATGRTVMSDVIVSRADNDATILICSPYFAGQTIAGVACGILRLESIGQLVQNSSLPQATMTVVDPHGRVIFASSESGRKALQDLNGDPIFAGSGAEQANGTFIYTIAGRKAPHGSQLVARTTVPDTGWHVYVEQSLIGMRLQTTKYYALTLATDRPRAVRRRRRRRGIFRGRRPSARRARHSGAQRLGAKIAGGAPVVEPPGGSRCTHSGRQHDAEPSRRLVS